MKTGTSIRVLLIAIAFWCLSPATGWADHHEEVSNPDLKCFKCHSKGLKKKLEDGEVMSLKIDVDNFATSVHSVIGCTGCHRDIPGAKHPAKQPIESRRAYSLKHNQTCSQCHAEKHEDYSSGVHAKLVADGNVDAPLCSDCHSSHAIQHRVVYEPVSGEPCSDCHKDIYDAYAESVHGVARSNGNEIRGNHVRSPICSDCHQSHNVSGVATTDHLVSQCVSCHEVAELAHEQWLPNAKMHMQSVSCPACHSPEAERRIDLQLYDRLTEMPVGQDGNDKLLQEQMAAIDLSEDGLDSIELWKLLRETGESADVVLRGRMEVTTGVQAHSLAPSSKAVRSCESCHTKGSEPFQNVTVSISDPNGQKERFPASQSVLDSPVSVDSLGGFYAPGGTRIKLLDGLLVLALAGGLAVPVGHLALGRFVKKAEKNNHNNEQDSE